MISQVTATWIFWAAVLCCAIAQIAILRSTVTAWVAARRSHADARSGSAAELLWVALPAVMLALVLLLTWRAIDARAHTASAQPTHDLPLLR